MCTIKPFVYKQKEKRNLLCKKAIMPNTALYYHAQRRVLILNLMTSACAATS